MSARTIHVENLRVVLHGVSADMAEPLGIALRTALEDRGRRHGAGFVSSSRSMASLESGRMDCPVGIEASALAQLIADGMFDLIESGADRDSPQEDSA